MVIVAGLALIPPTALAQGLAQPQAPAGAVPGTDATLAALAFALATAPAQGQLPLGTPAPGANGGASVELSLEVSAREIVYDALPRVRTPADPDRRATWRVERVNLPSRVEPGLAYQNVVVRVFLFATPAAFEALLEDARRAAPLLRIVPALASAPDGTANGVLARP